MHKQWELLRHYERIRSLVTSGVHAVGAPQEKGGHGTRTAETAFQLAKSWIEGEKRGLTVGLDHDDIPWDGDGPAPKFVVVLFIYKEGEPRKWYASLGGIGTNSVHNDPYIEIEGYHLMHEAVTWLREEEDKEACAMAEELSSRATYASAFATYNLRIDRG